MSEIYCPVDECDGGPYDNLAGLRGHVNGKKKSDKTHDWGAIKEQVEGPDPTDSGKGDVAGSDDTADDTTDSTNQPDQEPTDSSNSDTSDSTDQPDQDPTDSGKGDVAGSDDTADDTSDSAMPTDEEYQALQGSKSDDGSDSDTTDDTSDDTSDSGGLTRPNLPVDPRTLLLVVAVAAVGWMLYQAITGPSEVDNMAGSDSEGDDLGGSEGRQDDTTEETSDNIEGGLVQ
jgi:hypothetical protein